MYYKLYISFPFFDRDHKDQETCQIRKEIFVIYLDNDPLNKDLSFRIQFPGIM